MVLDVYSESVPEVALWQVSLTLCPDVVMQPWDAKSMIPVDWVNDTFQLSRLCWHTAFKVPELRQDPELSVTEAEAPLQALEAENS